MAAPAETKKTFIDLTDPQDGKFVLVNGWCGGCKRKTDILKKISMCHICIIVNLAAAHKIDVRTPPGYVMQEKPDECVICLQPIYIGQIKSSCLYCVGVCHHVCMMEWGTRSGKKECPSCRISWER